MGTCDDSPRLQAEGECPDTGVSSHTTRSVHAQKPAMRHPQLMYRMARHWNTGAFFPLARSPRTHRNAILLKTCKGTTYLFFLSGTQVEMSTPPRSK